MDAANRLSGSRVGMRLRKMPLGLPATQAVRAPEKINVTGLELLNRRENADSYFSGTFFLEVA
jgi:hypothetical protein